MVKVIKFIRERTSFTLVVYMLIYFRSSRMASDILSFIILGYVFILLWFILSCLSLIGDVRIMVDDTIISVGSMRRIVYIVFKPLLRRILYIWVCDAANIPTSLTLEN